jgi:hypothetical protein
LAQKTIGKTSQNSEVVDCFGNGLKREVKIKYTDSLELVGCLILGDGFQT